MSALSELKNVSPMLLFALDMKIVANTMEEVKNFLEGATDLEPTWFLPALASVQYMAKTMKEHADAGHDLNDYAKDGISTDLNYIAKKLAMAQNILESATHRRSWIDPSLAIVRDYARLLDVVGQRQKEDTQVLEKENALMKQVVFSEAGLQLAAKMGISFYQPDQTLEAKSNDLTTRDQAQPTNSLGKTASWVIKNRETGEIIMETFNRKHVDALNTAKYEAVPILEHLQSLNKKNEVKPEPRANEAGYNAAEVDENTDSEESGNAPGM